jgi:3-hydroxyacyl-CoA dehydrogenase/enoyl-CoA hydratase/3-hydroxybutyryl-CoA epimerase
MSGATKPSGAAMSAAPRTLSLTVDADGIALITLDDPSRPVNVTSPELVGELLAALDRVAADPVIRGAVLVSGKADSFVAGGDIKDYVGAHDRGMTEAEAFEISRRWNVDLRRVERCGKPLAAAIHGVALGGGFELALCCHHRVLAGDERARVGLVEVGIGLLPAGGGTQRLPRLIGVAPALAAMLEARRMRADEALACGAVDAVVPRDELLVAARAWVCGHPQAVQPWDVPGFRAPGADAFDWARARTDLLARTRGRYPAPLACFDAVRDGIEHPIEEGLAIESRHSAALLPGAVARNLMRTGFVHRHLARFYADGSHPYVLRLRNACEREVAALLDEGVSRERIQEAARAADWDALPWPATPPRCGAHTPQPRVDDVVQRLLHAVALEGVRCLDERIVDGPADADVGAVAGIGYPRWTGGVLSYIETVGLDRFVHAADRLARLHGARYTPPASLRERVRAGRKFHAPPQPEAVIRSQLLSPMTAGARG